MVESRVEQGSRLRSMYRSLGWSRADCAKFLHVTERCLHNWERGRHAIPHAAYKLVRLHLGYELPGRDWDGWSISRGRLCTPEGHELNPLDAKWWHLLCRRADTGMQAIRKLHALKTGRRADAGPVSAGSAAHASAGPAAAPLPGAAGGAAASAAAGLVLSKTSQTQSTSKTIAATGYAIPCYQFRMNGGQS